ncbi:MAG TPA: class I lanthipeptide [Polyangia bacterium]|nr:class I lanthipeptide [Polyangia bacterium]
MKKDQRDQKNQKPAIKKLVLRKETVRALEKAQLSRAAGGYEDAPTGICISICNTGSSTSNQQ